MHQHVHYVERQSDGKTVAVKAHVRFSDNEIQTGKRWVELLPMRRHLIKEARERGAFDDHFRASDASGIFERYLHKEAN